MRQWRAKGVGVGLVLGLLLLTPLAARADTTVHRAPQEVLVAAAEPEDTIYTMWIKKEEPAAKGPKTVETEEISKDEEIPDPLEPWNRAMFSFNDRFYFWVYRPFAEGYNTVVAEEGRVGIRNFFRNLAMPVRFVNNLLQLKFERAGIELARFGVNTVAGFVGCVDTAGEFLNLKRQDEDFGQTLGTYGIPHGLYFVWPFIGPSSLRDTVGMAGDSFLHPLNYIFPAMGAPIETEWALGIRAYDYANDRSLRLGEYEDFLKMAIDPYLSMRDAYYQYRKRKVAE
jgi:phospholipid-binding lipoprotein MlaA